MRREYFSAARFPARVMFTAGDAESVPQCRQDSLPLRPLGP
jgi:hypothetical protein